MTQINGVVNERFAAVAEALQRNFADPGEIGASAAVVHNGELVVDIWAGHTDEQRTQEWEKDTITNVWSTTKTMMAISALVLADRGELDFYKPVADYWPEFKAKGKGDIEVRHIMSHTSGLSGWGKKISMREVCDWEKSTAILAGQKPWWKPGTSSGYHMLNQGHLVGEVIRRITGMSIGRFFKEEIADPLGADFHIGLDESEFHRISNVIYPKEEFGDQIKEFTKSLGKYRISGKVAMKTFMNPTPDDESAWENWWRSAEVPAANGHGNARSVAMIQGLISNGGEMNGVKLLKQETIDLIFDEQSHGPDLVLLMPLRFGIGYGLPNEEFPFLPQDGKVCFWGGWGGSLIVNDVDNGLTVSYMMNKMMQTVVGDTRGLGILEAAYDSIK
tara:strand:- start:94 stop:1260 length:1167 start_codon:yes stop_codon:yes gene_type:complete